MTYALLHLTHLLAAIFFIGIWFAQIAVLHNAERQLDTTAQRTLDAGWSRRTRAVLHAVVLFVYGAGIGLGWQYRAVLADPLASRFALLLTIKIALAVSVFLSFGVIAVLARSGAMTARRHRLLERAVLAQMLAIVVLAKAMFYAG